MTKAPQNYIIKEEKADGKYNTKRQLVPYKGILRI